MCPGPRALPCTGAGPAAGGPSVGLRDPGSPLRLTERAPAPVPWDWASSSRPGPAALGPRRLLPLSPPPGGPRSAPGACGPCPPHCGCRRSRPPRRSAPLAGFPSGGLPTPCPAGFPQIAAPRPRFPRAPAGSWPRHHGGQCPGPLGSPSQQEASRRSGGRAHRPPGGEAAAVVDALFGPSLVEQGYVDEVSSVDNNASLA